MPTIEADRFSLADFRQRVAMLPHNDPDHFEDGDHRFNPGHQRMQHHEPLRAAAVLIPLVDREEGPSVLLTKRAETLRAHTGQVAFPGGRIDASDAGPEAAALREAHEEIGLEPGRVEVIGRMPDYISGSGYRIVPVIAVVRPGFRLALNPTEVDAAFEVPLAFLMDPVNHGRESRVWGDREWFYFDMRHGERRIWGVTAGIVRTLYERLYA